MANELICNPRRTDQPIIGDKLMSHGSHVRSGTDNRVSAGGAGYIVTPGVGYVQLYATVDLWVRASHDGSAPAAGVDQFLAAKSWLDIFSVPFEHDLTSSRRLNPGDQIKCIAA